MSYCRNNGQDSDVYVYESIYGCLVCCGCSLKERLNKGTEYTTRSFNKMQNHLKEHEAAGDLVPERAYERLSKEMNESKNGMIPVPHHMKHKMPIMDE